MIRDGLVTEEDLSVESITSSAEGSRQGCAGCGAAGGARRRGACELRRRLRPRARCRTAAAPAERARRRRRPSPCCASPSDARAFTSRPSATRAARRPRPAPSSPTTEFRFASYRAALESYSYFLILSGKDVVRAPRSSRGIQPSRRNRSDDVGLYLPETSGAQDEARRPRAVFR